MTCDEARSGLWPPETPRLCEEDVLSARAHVDECADCRAFFEQDRALLDAYDRLRETGAPRAVRERLFDVLARERAGLGSEPPVQEAARASTNRLLVASLAVLGLATSLAIGWASRGAVPIITVDAGDVFMEDYLRRAVGEEHIETSDPAEVTAFLTRELGMPVSPLMVAGLAVEKAEICLLEGRRGAMIVYKGDGRVISHYLIPREEAEVRPPSSSALLEEALSQDGMPAVVLWATPRLEQALVGPVPADRLLEIARVGTTY